MCYIWFARYGIHYFVHFPPSLFINMMTFFNSSSYLHMLLHCCILCIYARTDVCAWEREKEIIPKQTLIFLTVVWLKLMCIIQIVTISVFCVQYHASLAPTCDRTMNKWSTGQCLADNSAWTLKRFHNPCDTCVLVCLARRVFGCKISRSELFRLWHVWFSKAFSFSRHFIITV